MNAERKRLALAIRSLSVEERQFISYQSAAISAVERRWRAKYEKAIREFDIFVFNPKFNGQPFNFRIVDFAPLVMQQAFEVSTFGEVEADDTQTFLRLAKKAPPPIKIPKTFAGLRQIYDRYRRTGYLPPHQKNIAERLKRYYIDRCQSVWKKHAKDFLAGKQFNQSVLQQILAKEGDMAKSRAEQISNTETTNYYNASRKEVYDRSPDVTHYLFVAIRDRATTKWCRSRQGLVFTKGTKLCDYNTPACHWNCRSEMLPLTPANPRHFLLIENQSLRAEKNSLFPLPPGWRGASR